MAERVDDDHRRDPGARHADRIAELQPEAVVDRCRRDGSQRDEDRSGELCDETRSFFQRFGTLLLARSRRARRLAIRSCAVALVRALGDSSDALAYPRRAARTPSKQAGLVRLARDERGPAAYNRSMSRAFVKERDDEPPEPVVGVERTEPHLVTARGLELLKAELEQTTDPRRRSLLLKRIDAAHVTDPPADRSRVAFGATVTVSGAADKDATYTIVGEDEAEVRKGKISVTSPLAEALLGKRVGEDAIWHRPAGDRPLKIQSIRYED
jgi:transcription elongation GreA/GreB family factor